MVAGVEEGDRLVSLDGRPVGTYDDFRTLIAASETGPAELVVQRDGRDESLDLDLARRVKIIGTVR